MRDSLSSTEVIAHVLSPFYASLQAMLSEERALSCIAEEATPAPDFVFLLANFAAAAGNATASNTMRGLRMRRLINHGKPPFSTGISKGMKAAATPSLLINCSNMAEKPGLTCLPA